MIAVRYRGILSERSKISPGKYGVILSCLILLLFSRQRAGRSAKIMFWKSLLDLSHRRHGVFRVMQGISLYELTPDNSKPELVCIYSVHIRIVRPRAQLLYLSPLPVKVGIIIVQKQFENPREVKNIHWLVA
jgi:hypothetical protein